MKSTPLKLHGGKSYLRDEIIGRIPDHVHYVEPYFGAGQVLFGKPDHLIENHSEVANDLNHRLVNFWEVIRNRRQRRLLIEMLTNTPFSRTVWTRARYGLEPHRSPTAKAWAFMVEYRQSRQGLGKCFATLSKNRTRRGMNEQVSSWHSAIESIEEAGERLKRVVLENRDGVQCIRSEDTANTFFYCDPPYLHSTRYGKGSNSDYEYENSDEEHEQLLITLGGIKGKFILSGKQCPLYDEYADRFNWGRVDIKIETKSSARRSKQASLTKQGRTRTKPLTTECLWMNY